MDRILTDLESTQTLTTVQWPDVWANSDWPPVPPNEAYISFNLINKHNIQIFNQIFNQSIVSNLNSNHSFITIERAITSLIKTGFNFIFDLFPIFHKFFNFYINFINFQLNLCSTQNSLFKIVSSFKISI